ncbi:MAG: DUF3788 family protein [Gemmatimonadaceae bacterium]|nr:DUF3788 family protein [Gemmatimonadaceae bacterium]
MKRAPGGDDGRWKTALGAADAMFTGIVRVVEELASPLDIEWKSSKIAFGHVCLLRHKKRTLLYLLPEKSSITVAIVLGERAYGLAMASTLSTAIKTSLSEARPYAEGRGIRVPVRTSRDFATIRKLVAIKLTPK